MAKVRGPLLSIEASGKVGHELLYRTGKGGSHVYRPADPSSVNQRPPSASQTTVRTRYQAAAQAWRNLDDQQRAAWNAKAKMDPRNVHGWALWLEHWTGGEPPPTGPDPNTYIPPAGNACHFPGYTWVGDTPYTPPPGNLWT